MRDDFRGENTPRIGFAATKVAFHWWQRSDTLPRSLKSKIDLRKAAGDAIIRAFVESANRREARLPAVSRWRSRLACRQR